MIKNPKFIALIPARSGSKGLKNKNLLKISNRTLVEIAIDNALSSKLISKVYLTSDSRKILDIGNKKKINNIFRSKKYSSDTATSKDVISHFLTQIKTLEIFNNYIVYIQPSSPLLKSKHINNAIRLIKKKKSNCLISCYRSESEKFFKSLQINHRGKITPTFKKNFLYTNRQSFKDVYIPNGCIFIFRIKKNFLKKYIDYADCIPYIMKHNDVIDINNKRDLLEARKIFVK
jgi:CMP-N-acetylneuraminic acid synthetase